VPVTVRYDEDAGVVEMVYVGETSQAETDAAMVEAGMVGVEKLVGRFLVDAREVEGLGSAFDVLAIADFLSSLPPGVIEREAVVLPRDPGAAEQMEFFETAARNRGLNVRVFRAREDALAWLAG
jgi:hypothetical protein